MNNLNFGIVKKSFLYSADINMVLLKQIWIPTLLLVLVTNVAVSQYKEPATFSFQGCAKDVEGKPVLGTVNLRFTIHKDDPLGEVVYTEEVLAGTNASGLFNAVIGQNGSVLLSTIDWSHGRYFLQTEIAVDQNNLTAFSDLGSERLRGMPYAFLASEASRLSDYNPMVVRGDAAKGSVMPSIGIGPRLIWHPKKAAFRVGYSTNGHWEDQQIGDNSFAAGKDTWAPANAATALGLGTIAKIDHCTSVGTYNDNSDVVGNGVGRIFQVGVGSDNANRKNALTIMKVNGYVGIGQAATNPKYALDVDSRMRVQYKNVTSGIFFNNSFNQEEGFVGMANNNEIGFYSESSGKWLLVANKNGTVYMDNYFLTSDKRKKTDFANLYGSLGKLTQLNGYHYHWLDKTRSQELQTGLIAQEVEKLFPELVSTNENGNKSLNYNGLIPHMIEAIKELNQQNAQLIKRIKALEK